MVLTSVSSGAIEALATTALANARLHGGCSKVNVTVRPEDRLVRIIFEDRGPGLPAGEPRFAPDRGLTRTRNHLRELGGDLIIKNNAGPGVTVEAWWRDEGP